MSLHEVADGLLGTHVTWQEVEEQMQKALSTSARFGADKKVTNISDMKGFMSRIALIDPDWTGARDEKEPELPQRFIVKISSQLPMIEMMKLMEFGTVDDKGADDFWTEERLAGMGAMTRLLHNREVDTYKLLMREKVARIPFTKIYALKKFDEECNLKGYIISEFVPDLHSIGMHESIPYLDLIPAVHAVAAFSAMGQKLPEEDVKFARGPDFLDLVFSQFMDEKSAAKSEQVIKESFTEEHQPKVEEMLAINREFYTNQNSLPRFKKTSEFIGHKEVFTHSDLWSSNMLCTKNKEGKVTIKAIIDYQTVSFTTPAQDVGRLFVACLSAKDRREHADFLLEEYYKVFVEELDGAEVPYTLQQLKDSYQLYFPLMTVMVLPGIAPLLEHLPVPVEEKEKLKEAAYEKMVGLLEDVISTHKASMEKFPDYFKL